MVVKWLSDEWGNENDRETFGEPLGPNNETVVPLAVLAARNPFIEPSRFARMLGISGR